MGVKYNIDVGYRFAGLCDPNYRLLRILNPPYHMNSYVHMLDWIQICIVYISYYSGFFMGPFINYGGQQT